MPREIDWDLTWDLRLTTLDLFPCILHLSTGFASPQYHCRHDDFVETVADAPKDDAQWKFAAHFKSITLPNEVTSSSAPAFPINQASPPPPSNTPISVFQRE
jgi:hypothetical protein